MASMAFVNDQVKSSKVVVFSKTHCPYCTMAKSALKDAGLKQSDYLLIELDERDDGSAIQDALVKITGARTVGLHFFVLELVKYLFYYEN